MWLVAASGMFIGKLASCNRLHLQFLWVKRSINIFVFSRKVAWSGSTQEQPKLTWDLDASDEAS